jgi:putative ABC transport system permease protein
LVELIPTGPGDPLLSEVTLPIGPDSVVLSAKLAEILDVTSGDTIRGFVTRNVAGRPERTDIILTVSDVLPERFFGRNALFAPLALLVAVEDYRDGYAAPDYGWDGESRDHVRDSFSSARLYAKDLESVPLLAEVLEEEGETVRSRAAEIAGIQSLDQSLTLGFWIIAGLGAAGYFFSLAASLWSNVERKRVPLSVMSLLGMRKSGLLSFPATQGTVIGLLGAGVACGLFFMAQFVVDKAFSGLVGATESSICRLLPLHFVSVFLATLVFSGVASLWATQRVARITPSYGMRET